MSQLKKYRLLLNLTQKELAEHLNTTQQTVARWEAGKSPIPTAQLKDLAIFFGCSIDKLLEHAPSSNNKVIDIRSALRNPEASDSVPYGTAIIKLQGINEEITLPINKRSKEYIECQMNREEDDYGILKAAKWIEVSSLDNYLLFINSTHLVSIETLSDDVEQMPSFEHREVYKILQDWDKDIPECSEQLSTYCAKIIEKKGKDKITLATNYMKVVFNNGHRENILLDEDVASMLFDLSSNLDNINNDHFLMVKSEFGLKSSYYRLSSIAYVELPSERYLDLIAEV